MKNRVAPFYPGPKGC